MNDRTPQSPVPGQTLYRAFGTGENEPFMMRWIVSSIEPEKGTGGQGPMVVYVTGHPDDEGHIDCDILSFPLSRWSHGVWLQATERAAWAKCLENTRRELSCSITHRDKAILDGDHEMAEEWRGEITRLTRNYGLVKDRLKGGRR